MADDDIIEIVAEDHIDVQEAKQNPDLQSLNQWFSGAYKPVRRALVEAIEADDMAKFKATFELVKDKVQPKFLFSVGSKMANPPIIESLLLTKNIKFLQFMLENEAGIDAVGTTPNPATSGKPLLDILDNRINSIITDTKAKELDADLVLSLREMREELINAGAKEEKSKIVKPSGDQVNIVAQTRYHSTDTKGKTERGAVKKPTRTRTRTSRTIIKRGGSAIAPVQFFDNPTGGGRGDIS